MLVDETTKLPLRDRTNDDENNDCNCDCDCAADMDTLLLDDDDDEVDPLDMLYCGKETDSIVLDVASLFMPLTAKLNNIVDFEFNNDDDDDDDSDDAMLVINTLFLTLLISVENIEDGITERTDIDSPNENPPVDMGNESDICKLGETLDVDFVDINCDNDEVPPVDCAVGAKDDSIIDKATVGWVVGVAVSRVRNENDINMHPNPC